MTAVPQPPAEQRGDVAARCQAQIWPSWGDRWTPCHSPIGRDGRCLTYRHPDHEHRCTPAVCAFGYARCPVAAALTDGTPR